MAALPILQALEDNAPPSESMRILGTLSRLFSYPDEHYVSLVELLYVLLNMQTAEYAQLTATFGQTIVQLTDTEQEELYTRTFDLNPSCALEIGWHLFGEDYMRGQFLVRMRGELARYGVPETAELPDHLSHVLAVLAAMPQEKAQQFAHACVFPALHKMATALTKAESPFYPLLHCLLLVLEEIFGPSEPWSEEEDRLLHNNGRHDGQNGPRQPGLGDPLRSYPMPTASGCDPVTFVPLGQSLLSPIESDATSLLDAEGS